MKVNQYLINSIAFFRSTENMLLLTL